MDFQVALPGQPGVEKTPVEQQYHQGDCSAYGVVILSIPGDYYQGPLSLKTLQHQVTHAAIGNHESCALFSVTASFAFHNVSHAVELHEAGTRRMHTVTPVARTSANALLRLEGTGIAMGDMERIVEGPRSLHEWLLAHGCKIPDQGIIMNAYFAPAPLRELYVRGAWRVVAFGVPKLRGCGSSLSQMLGDLPKPDADVVYHGPQIEMNFASGPPTFDSFQREALDTGAALRRWAPSILAADASSKELLNKALSWIDGCVTRLSPMGVCTASNAWGHHVFQTTFLLRCAMLARLIRNSKKLASAIKQSVALVLPTEIADYVRQVVDSKHIKLPDRSTLSRFLLTLDTAYMLDMRQHNAACSNQNGPPTSQIPDGR